MASGCRAGGSISNKPAFGANRDKKRSLTLSKDFRVSLNTR